MDASLSQSATAETAGVKTQVASLLTAGLMLATAVVLAPLFTNLPDAVLGAIVIAAVLGLMDVAELRRYWRSRRTDFLLALVALVGVVTTSVLVGLVIAVMLSLVMLLYRASRPYLAVLGKLPGTRSTFVDVGRHPDAEPVPGLLMLRLDAPLYFFNANVARTAILAVVDAADPRPADVLIDISATADLDITTADVLRQLVGDLRDRSIGLLLAQVKGSVRDRMRRSDLMERRRRGPDPPLRRGGGGRLPGRVRRVAGRPGAPRHSVGGLGAASTESSSTNAIPTHAPRTAVGRWKSPIVSRATPMSPPTASPAHAPSIAAIPTNGSRASVRPRTRT